MRPTSIPSLGESLREYLNSHDRIVDPSLLDMQAVDEADVIERKLEAAREDLATIITGGLGSRPRKAAESAIALYERSLIYALRRDEIMAGRPDGCWCLGAGGRRPMGVPMPTGDSYTLTSTSGDGTHDGEDRKYVQPVEILGEYCICPEAVERERSDNEYRRMSRQWREKLRIKRVFGKSHIPLEYRRFPWRSLPKPRAVAQSSAWLDRRGEHPWLLLWGDPGRGKTTIMYGIAGEVAVRGEAVLCKTLPDLLQELRTTYKPDGEGDSPIIDATKSVPWLFLDDIGAEVPSGWSGDRLYQIMNHRHNEQLPTVLSSNLGLVALQEHLGERLHGRIKRMALPVFVGGSDLRDLAHGQAAEDEAGA